MTASWKAEVVAALRRFTQRHHSLQIERAAFLAEELSTMVRATASTGRTPAQTVSRVLQELRDEGWLYFSSADVYILQGLPLNAVAEDFPEDALEHAAQAGTLVLEDVPASEAIAQVRSRRGVAALRRAALLNYGSSCALCGIADPRLLVTSHIARWADRPDARGYLSHVICFCRLHDPLFEMGYFALSDDLAVIWRPGIESSCIRVWAEHCNGEFRAPPHYVPAQEYVREHRARVRIN